MQEQVSFVCFTLEFARSTWMPRHGLAAMLQMAQGRQQEINTKGLAMHTATTTKTGSKSVSDQADLEAPLCGCAPDGMPLDGRQQCSGGFYDAQPRQGCETARSY